MMAAFKQSEVPEQSPMDGRVQERNTPESMNLAGDFRLNFKNQSSGGDIRAKIK